MTASHMRGRFCLQKNIICISSRCMVKYWFFIMGVPTIALAVVLILFSYLRPVQEYDLNRQTAIVEYGIENKVRIPTVEERVAEAKERASRIKGIYMTADVASDGGAGATQLRRSIIELAERTEINGMVIDVKEVCGPDYNEARIRALVDELHAKGIWAIARVAAFKDASQINVHPEWYLTRAVKKEVVDSCSRKAYLRTPSPDGIKSPTVFWQDNKGGYWLDPSSESARAYLLDFSKRMVDLGFDELQFDYVRFPSDGDTQNARYPAWDKKISRFDVMRSFFEYLNRNLKEYKPELILSADLFGYVASQGEDATIGQRLDDIGRNFDYISFMVYPSHYYSGLYLPVSKSGLPAIQWDYKTARANPGIVVERSLLFAREYLDGLFASSTASTTLEALHEAARFRPWLEDFFHEIDRVADRPYGAEKVRLQIEGSERVEDHGWLLWNASNVYTEGALENISDVTERESLEFPSLTPDESKLSPAASLGNINSKE